MVYFFGYFFLILKLKNAKVKFLPYLSSQHLSYLPAFYLVRIKFIAFSIYIFFPSSLTIFHPVFPSKTDLYIHCWSMTERPAFSHPLYLKWNGKSQKSHESLYLPESLRIKKSIFPQFRCNVSFMQNSHQGLKLQNLKLVFIFFLV